MQIWLLYVAVGTIASQVPSESVKIDPQTVLVLFGTRHGNRNPAVFLDENPRTWGFEGDTELTSIGKRQAFGLGEEMRRFVGKLVSENYNRSESNFYSSSANRCQMTLQLALAGLYKPVGWAKWDVSRGLHWGPVPYTIDDAMLRMYSLTECKNNNKVWGPIYDDSLPVLANAKKKSALLLAYIGEKTGWNMSSLSTAADFADNLIEIDIYNASYPAWVTSTTLEGYDEKKLVKEALEFAEIHQIACTNYQPCRDLMSGVWLEHILNAIANAQIGKGPHIIGYASHNEVTLAVMKQLGIVKNELTTSAGFVLEFRIKPVPSVRLLNHDPDPIDKHVIYLVSDYNCLLIRAQLIPKLANKTDADGFISLDVFKNQIKDKAFSDWKTRCGDSTECSVLKSVEASSIPLYMNLQNNARVSISVTICTITFVFFLYCRP